MKISITPLNSSFFFFFFQKQTSARSSLIMTNDTDEYVLFASLLEKLKFNQFEDPFDVIEEFERVTSKKYVGFFGTFLETED